MKPMLVIMSVIMSVIQLSVKRWFAGLLLSGMTSLAIAADEVAKKTPTLAEDNLAGHLLQTTLGLIAVLLLIGAAAWAMKRFGNLKVGAQGKLRILGGISLGTRERVVLLEVGEQQLVLGVAPGRITTLHVLAEPLPVDPQQRPKFASGGFADRLQAVLRGENPNKRSMS